MIKKRIFKCHFLLTNDLKNKKNSNVLISCIFLFPSSKQKGLLCRASIMFEIDQSGATINPLRKDKAPVLPVEEPNEGKETKPYNKWIHALRAVFFVLVPQFVWMLEYAYVENHFLMLAYVQIVYVVVLQSVLVETFVEHDQQKGKVRLILCLMGLLYIGTCIGLRSPQAFTGTVEGAGSCECGECEPYSTEDISKDAYPSFFSSGDTVMGIRMEVNGTRLSRGGTLEAIGLLAQHLHILVRHGHTVGLPVPEGCATMFSTTVLSSFVRPCDQSCVASNLSTSSCQRFMEGCDPSFLRGYDFDSSWDRFYPFISGLNIFDNAAETALSFDMVKQGFKNVGLFPYDKRSFCASPLLFTDNYNVFSCTNNGALKETQSFSHTLAKASWASIPILVWALLALFKPQYTIKKGTYTKADILQLVLCFLFLTSLAGVLVHKLVSFGEAAGHGVGIVLVGVSYLYCSALFALLKGKSSREVNTKETNPILKWYNTFKILTDVNDGPYYFAYTFVVEVFEIVTQSFSFDAMVRTNDLNYVRWSVTIISLNLVLTPMSFLASRYGRQSGRKLTFALDTLLESAYLFLNLNVVRERDLAQVSVMLSILLPLFTLLGKVDTFLEATTTFVENRERRDSWVQKSFKVKLKTIKHKWNTKSKVGTGLAVMLTSGLGVLVFVYMMSSAYRIDLECGEIIGVDVWENARPRHVFADGPLLPNCNFDSIKEVRARQTGIKTVRKEIGLLTSLVHLDLSGNKIERLPVQITKMKALVHVNMADNPVWKVLDWQGQQLDTFPGILRFFTKLERLNLGHNRIAIVPESIGRLQRLSELTLQNNSISALSQQITRLTLLKTFKVRHNPVASSLSWHGVDPDGAVRIFRFMGEMIELDISNGRFESLVDVQLALPMLRRLNASNNLLRTVVSAGGSHVRELDLSKNPGMYSVVWEDGELESIKLNGLLSLQVLSLRGNQFQSSDVNHLTALTFLSLAENRIQYIDLNGSTALVHLSLYNNKLQSIGVNHLTALTFLSLENNTLQSIDLTGLLALAYLDLRGNQLKSIKNITGLNRAITNLDI